jgi:hypothetical protein
VKAEVAVVLPTCRGWSVPDQSIPVDWIIVHDRQRWKVKENEHNVRHIVSPDRTLYGEKTSAIRQAGLDAAYDAGNLYVLTLDDDCVVPYDWAESHVKALRGRVPVCWNTVPGQVIRGRTLDHDLPVGISHGLWSGVLDYPAWWQVANNPGLVEIEDRGWERIPFPFPMCGMNVGFRREVLPAVYFQHQFLRHDDIFAGFVAQRILELHGYGFVNGGAVVQHRRASNAEVNWKKEKPGDEIAKRLLDHISSFSGTYMDSATAFLYMAFHLEELNLNSTFQRMVQDMFRWATRKENAE